MKFVFIKYILNSERCYNYGYYVRIIDRLLRTADLQPDGSGAVSGTRRIFCRSPHSNKRKPLMQRGPGAQSFRKAEFSGQGNDYEQKE